MAGWYEVSKNDKGEFWFVLKAANGEVVLRSEQYQSKASALNGVASVQKHAADAAQYRAQVAKDSRLFFNLHAANNQVIGTSQMYTTSSARVDGIASVQRNGPTTDVREV